MGNWDIHLDDNLRPHGLEQMKIEEAVNPDLMVLIGRINIFLEEMGAHPYLIDRACVHYDRIAGDYYTVFGRFGSTPLYNLRLLTPAGADYFLEAADMMADHFTPNGEEGVEYQIPEVILNRFETTKEHDALAREIGREVLWPLFHIMYGHPPNHFSSVQLARYSAPENAGTGWHSDTESEASCVVSLAPERHMGGGTMLMPYGALGPSVTIPPLHKGEALLFNGRTTLHRGLEVEHGERNMLVYWMQNKDC